MPTEQAHVAETVPFSDMSFDELTALFRKTPSLGIADELVSRAQLIQLSNKQLLQDVLTLYRTRYVMVIDFEATCFGPKEPQDMVNDVTEVGLALLDTRTYEVVERKQWYVRPTNSVVTPFCTELTGITPEMVATAPTYAETVRLLEQYAQEHPLGPITCWVSYGDADPHYLDRQSEREGVLRPWSSLKHFNMKQLAGRFFGFGKKKNPGLKKALGLANIEMEGRHHSGVDDAFNTAKLLAFLLEEQVRPA